MDGLILNFFKNPPTCYHYAKSNMFAVVKKETCHLATTNTQSCTHAALPFTICNLRKTDQKNKTS
jgi:hypothetical protein